MKKIWFEVLFVVFCPWCIQPLTAQEFDYLPQSKKGMLVQHQYYTLSYVEKYKCAEWVAYCLTKKMLEGSAKRKNNFLIDPFVAKGTAGPHDYPGREYQRGHLCPAEDMSFSQEATDTTFYMSNMTPQMGSFNTSIWKKMENKVRAWAKKYKEVFIVSGPVLKRGLQKIGPKRDISVPMQFYKIILARTKNETKMIAFLVPHRKTTAALKTFAVPVDSVERLTGIDFFPALPNNVEKEKERKVEFEGWDDIN